ARELTPRVMAEENADADPIISSTGARGVVVPRHDIVPGPSQNPKGAANQAFVDVALPHDIDASVHEVAHLALSEPGEIRELLKNSDKERDAKVVSTVEEVRGIIAEELDKIATGNRERSVAPTVTALRSHAKDVLASETARLEKKI